MKLLAFLLLAATSAFAQDSLVVNEIRDDMSTGIKPAYSVFIPGTQFKFVESSWKKKLKSGKGEITEKKNEIILVKGLLADISSDTMTVVSRIEPSEENKPGTNVTVFFIASDSTFINSVQTPSIDKRAKTYLRAFAVEQYKNSVVNEISIEDRKLNEMKEDLRRLERENENCTKKINSKKNDNARLQEEISAGADQIETKSGEITLHEDALKDASKSDIKEEEEKKIKQLQKERNKLSEELESDKKSLEKNNSQIDDLQKKFELNKSTNIPHLKDEIEKQKEVVADLSKKLNSIK
jgi:DNA repair exonuclease SbcCD ATPase subunit